MKDTELFHINLYYQFGSIFWKLFNITIKHFLSFILEMISSEMWTMLRWRLSKYCTKLEQNSFKEEKKGYRVPQHVNYRI